MLALLSSSALCADHSIATCLLPSAAALVAAPFGDVCFACYLVL